MHEAIIVLTKTRLQPHSGSDVDKRLCLLLKMQRTSSGLPDASMCHGAFARAPRGLKAPNAQRGVQGRCWRWRSLARSKRQKGRKNPKEQEVQKLHLSAEVLNSEWEEKVGKDKVQKPVRLRIQAQVRAIEFS